ncbi:Gfo/Idh/MocA family oxidoreductase [Streptomyces sp. H27-C3]|uniref:Gfo/Idh/MocA family protein n=1 Tax=Streptomyces sp. H27-C3 TaxID=3046305 RepID=UPI0024BA140B|nr:Gfo/Idh/MocA family oxidoreductase [Streptomyces sp. H27-C3]MDJ0462517.1 Gfo/Idh/MocA family oxidoreductase [Streptomyces sp. H27-C3]
MSPDASGAPPLRIAILGAGWVSRTVWRPLLDAHPGFEVAAVVDTDPVAAQRMASNGREVLAVSRVADLADLELDAAVVALPNHLHVPVACELLSRNVPVFIEKPVCRTLVEARTLASSALDGPTVHAWSAARHRGDVRALARLLPQLGEVRALGLNWTRASGVPQRDGWFVDRGLAGGGSLLDLGWHLLDVGLDLLGWPHVTRALGNLSLDWMGRGDATADWSARASDHGGPAGERPELVEDTARGFLLTETGVAVSLESRWASHHALDSTTLTIEGTEGVAVLRCTFGFSPHRADRSSLTLLRHGEETAVPLPEEPVGVEYERQVAELARRLVRARATGPRTDAGSLAEITTLASCVDRLYESAGRPRPPVPVPSLETARPRLRSH